MNAFLSRGEYSMTAVTRLFGSVNVVLMIFQFFSFSVFSSMLAELVGLG